LFLLSLEKSQGYVIFLWDFMIAKIATINCDHEWDECSVYLSTFLPDIFHCSAQLLLRDIWQQFQA